MKKLNYLLIFFLGVGAFLGVVRIGNIYIPGLLNFLAGEESKTIVNVTVEEIRNISKLVSVEYFLSTALERKFPIFLGNNRLILIFDGTVQGSVDLEKAKIDIDQGQRKVNISFERGAIEISNPIIKNTRSIAINSILPGAQINDQERDEAQKDGLKILRDKAIKNGIKQRTKEEAKRALIAFLKPYGYATHITFN